ncbi:huntingtin [Trichonephila clavipes]|nr:huntingtin [Trichonephila clavipes]
MSNVNIYGNELTDTLAKVGLDHPVLPPQNLHEFQLPILEQCLLLGAKLISSTEKYLSTKSNDPFLGITESPGSALYRSAQSTLLQHLADFMTLLPRASKHQNRMHKLFLEKSFWEILFFIVPSTLSFLVTQDLLPDRNIPSDSSDDIVHLSAICCEAVVWLIETSKTVSSEMLRITLFLLDKTLKSTELSSVIGSSSHTSKICLTISSVHYLMKYLQQDKNRVMQPDLVENASLTTEQRQAWKACVHMAEMIEWLEMSGSYQTDVSEHLFNPLKSVIRGLARLPLVNSFARAPPILWNLGWNPEFSGDFKTCIPTPSGEYLQDRDVLKQFIYRINLLGNHQLARIVRDNDESVREGYIRNGGKEVKLFTSALKAFQCNNCIVMAQRKHLDDFLRSRIIGRLECGRTQLEVSKELGIAQSVISRLWQRFQDDGNVSRCYSTGRPRVTTPNEDRYIFGSYCQKKQTEHSVRPVSSALFSYLYDSFKVNRVQTLRAHCSICSYACQMCSTYRNSLSLAINLE